MINEILTKIPEYFLKALLIVYGGIYAFSALIVTGVIYVVNAITMRTVDVNLSEKDSFKSVHTGFSILLSLVFTYKIVKSLLSRIFWPKNNNNITPDMNAEDEKRQCTSDTDASDSESVGETSEDEHDAVEDNGKGSEERELLKLSDDEYFPEQSDKDEEPVKPIELVEPAEFKEEEDDELSTWDNSSYPNNYLIMMFNYAQSCNPTPGTVWGSSNQGHCKSSNSKNDF